MAGRLRQLKLISSVGANSSPCGSIRRKSSSAHYVFSRARDPTFEKLMGNYKNFLKVIIVQDLILASSIKSPPSVSVDFLNRLSQRLHLNRGALAFLRKYPRIFQIFNYNSKCQPFCKLTDAAIAISQLESAAIAASLPLSVDRLVRILSMSVSKSVPLRAIFKVWKELGLPDDFEDSVIARNPHIFQLLDGNEPNTHILKLVDNKSNENFSAAIENWRVTEYCKEGNNVDRSDIKYCFKQSFPPSMRLGKTFKAKLKEWQRLPYIGPYEEMSENKRRSNTKAGMMGLEKRAAAIVHEFLSLTVEKMVEVEKISHFRKCFGIQLNIRDLFLDHPGIFYLSTQGKMHTMFLREGYERGCLIEPNHVYTARRKLFDLVLLAQRGLSSSDSTLRNPDKVTTNKQQESEEEEEEEEDVENT